MMRRASSPPTVRARRRSRGETGLHSFLPYNVYRFGEGMEGNNNRGGKVGTLLGGKIGSNISRGRLDYSVHSLHIMGWLVLEKEWGATIGSKDWQCCLVV